MDALDHLTNLWNEETFVTMNAVTNGEQCIYAKVIEINNEGVHFLHGGNIRAAMLSFQKGTVWARKLLMMQQRPRSSMAPLNTTGSSSSIYSTPWSNNMPYMNLEMMEVTPQDLSSSEESHLPNLMGSKRRHDLAGLRCTPSHQSLTGLNDGNYYVYDHPLVFQDMMSCDGSFIYDDQSAILMTIVVSFNFALSCHHAGKAFGQTQRYMAAAELYYLVWTVLQECCLLPDMWDIDLYHWHSKLQYVVLNNLVHVHDELNEFAQSEMCMASLRECILDEMKQTLGQYQMGPHPTSTIRRDGTSSFVSPYEFEKFKLNLLYFHKPNTARAA